MKKKNSFEFATAWCGHFELQKIPPKIVFFQLFVISSNFCPQIFDILLLETKTTLPSIKIYTRSFRTCFNHLQVPGKGCYIYILGWKKYWLSSWCIKSLFRDSLRGLSAVSCALLVAVSVRYGLWSFSPPGPIYD